jgi:tryptophanyl-tRNA synthetase
VFTNGRYGTFKRDLAEVVAGALAPVRERTAKYLAGLGTLDAVLPGGAGRARVIAGRSWPQVRGRSGFGGVV